MLNFNEDLNERPRWWNSFRHHFCPNRVYMRCRPESFPWFCNSDGRHKSCNKATKGHEGCFGVGDCRIQLSPASSGAYLIVLQKRRDSEAEIMDAFLCKFHQSCALMERKVLDSTTDQKIIGTAFQIMRALVAYRGSDRCYWDRFSNVLGSYLPYILENDILLGDRPKIETWNFSPTITKQ